MIFEIVLGIAAFIAVVIVIGVALYDLDEIRKQYEFKKHPHKKIYKNRPLISILIISSGDIDALRRCIESVLKNKYKKNEIIVISHGKSYRTKKLLHDYPKIKVSATKSVSVSAVRSVYKRQGNGDLLMTIDETSTIGTDALSQIVWQYNSENQPDIILLNSRVVSRYSSTGLFTVYYLMLLQLCKKMRSALQANYSLGVTNSVIKKEAIVSGTPHSSHFASDITVTVSTPHHYNQLVSPVADIYRGHRLQKIGLQFLRILLWLVAIFVISYFLYVAVLLHQPALLLFSITGLGLMILFAIYLDTALTLKEKVTYALLSPVTYVLFYLMSYINFLGEIRTMIPVKRHS